MVAFFCYLLCYLMETVGVGFPVCLDIGGLSVSQFKMVSCYVSHKFNSPFHNSLYQFLIVE